MLTLNIRLNNSVIPLDSKNPFFHRSYESFQKFKDARRLLAGLQNQYTRYSYNLVGEVSPN